MRKAGYVTLTVTLALVLLAVILILPSGAGSGALDREMPFLNTLWSSLSHLDLAKSQWAEEKHKPEQAVPTMEDLAPYLGQWTNSVRSLIALGIEFKITPISEMEPQSDMATLTRDLRFRRGFCRFYPAGFRYSLQTGCVIPESTSASRFREFYFNKRELLAIAVFVLAMGNLLVFVVKKSRNSKQVGSEIAHEHEEA